LAYGTTENDLRFRRIVTDERPPHQTHSISKAEAITDLIYWA